MVFTLFGIEEFKKCLFLPAFKLLWVVGIQLSMEECFITYGLDPVKFCIDWLEQQPVFFLPQQNLAKSHHLSSDAKDSKPLNYINTDIREQNIYNYD